MEEEEEYNPSLCQHCQKEEAHEYHTCPFSEEIHNDYESECNCCATCTRQCAMDI